MNVGYLRLDPGLFLLIANERHPENGCVNKRWSWHLSSSPNRIRGLLTSYIQLRDSGAKLFATVSGAGLSLALLSAKFIPAHFQRGYVSVASDDCARDNQFYVCHTVEESGPGDCKFHRSAEGEPLATRERSAPAADIKKIPRSGDDHQASSEDPKS
jgi:hypothetical protein